MQTHQLIARCRKSLYNGMKAGEVGTALVTAAVPLMETGPGYSQVCARLLLDSLWAEVSSRLGLQTAHGGDFRSGEYPGLFKASIHTGIELGLLPDSLLSYDLDRLAQALRPEYDSLFSYPRLQSLYERGLLQSQGTRLELPQSYFMRIAMSSALTENDFNARAIEFYQVLSRFDYMSSTPTPFNADTHHPQLSPCYPTTVQDKAEPEPSPVTKPLPAAEAIRQSLATHDINHP